MLNIGRRVGWVLRPVMVPLSPDMGRIVPDSGPLSAYVGRCRSKNGPSTGRCEAKLFCFFLVEMSSKKWAQTEDFLGFDGGYLGPLMGH